jgi:hypothetical protein
MEIVMTRPRQRMLEDMQLRGLSARTQGCYVAAVRQLAEHYHRSPGQITEEELRQYFLFLANEKQVARTIATIALLRRSRHAQPSAVRQPPRPASRSDSIRRSCRDIENP